MSDITRVRRFISTFYLILPTQYKNDEYNVTMHSNSITILSTIKSDCHLFLIFRFFLIFQDLCARPGFVQDGPAQFDISPGKMGKFS